MSERLFKRLSEIELGARAARLELKGKSFDEAVRVIDIRAANPTGSHARLPL
jgi:hypothetical protein